MASEPFFEEQSDAVKMSETPYPTNGSGKNLAKDTRIKYFFLCTHSCPYRLAGSALPSAFGGSEQLRKKEFIVFKMYKNKKYGNDSYKKAVPA